MRCGWWWHQRLWSSYMQWLIFIGILSGWCWKSLMALAPTFTEFAPWNFEKRPRLCWWKKRSIRPIWTRPMESLLKINIRKYLCLTFCLFGYHNFLKAQWTNMFLSMMVLKVFLPIHRDLGKVTLVHAIYINVVSYYLLSGAQRSHIFFRTAKHSKQIHSRTTRIWCCLLSGM